MDVKILICCALKQEALPLAKAFKLNPVHSSANIFEGNDGVREFRLILTGPGKENLRAAFPEIFQSPLPSAVISYGFAGALSSSLQKGDVVIANQVMLNDREKPIFQIPLKFQPGLIQKEPFAVYSGALLSTSDMAASPEEKKSLGLHFNALAVDMESGYLCEEVLKRKLKFFAVRGITDTLGEPIPVVTQNWTGPNGKILKLRMIRDIFKTPGIIPSLVRLGFASRKASRRMIQSLIYFLETIQ